MILVKGRSLSLLSFLLIAASLNEFNHSAVSATSFINRQINQESDLLQSSAELPLVLPLVIAQTTSPTYQEPNGLFEISLPAGYSYMETGSGIILMSEDQQFGGTVDFSSAQGRSFTSSELETRLKRAYARRFSQIAWQDTVAQSDGSLRISWVGVDPAGNRLESASFIEQRGDYVFILNLFSINAPYSDYVDEAQAIANTYRVN
jgi:hypothetical protein